MPRPASATIDRRETRPAKWINTPGTDPLPPRLDATTRRSNPALESGGGHFRNFHGTAAMIH
jgi:hypothetical protein